MAIYAKLLFTAVGLFSGGLGFSYLLKGLLRWKFKKIYISDYLPFEHVLNDGKTVLCRDGTYVQFIQMHGPLEGSLDPEDEKNVFQKKKNYFDAMASQGVPFRLLTRKKSHQTEPEGTLPNEMLQKIHNLWERQFLLWKMVEHTLIIQSPSQKELDENTAVALDYLAFFRPNLLEQSFQGEDPRLSPLLTFLSGLVNIHPCEILAFQNEVSEKISETDIHFNLENGVITLTQRDETQLWSLCSVKSFGDKVSSEVLQELYKLPIDLEIVHSFQGMAKYQSTALLNYRLRQETLFYKNSFKKEQFQQAIEQIDASLDTFYEYQVVIFIKAVDEKTLKDHCEMIRRVCIQYGIRLIQETSAIEWYWFSRFPSYDKFLRPRNVFARNLAQFLTFDSVTSGEEKSDWGTGPVRHFWTWDRQKYALQLHVSSEEEALAHTLTIAPSSGGKTTFFQHLIGGALRYPGLHAYIFDRFGGAEIFTRSMGGHYLKFDETLSLNPFLCDPTPENKFFLTHFLRRLGQIPKEAPNEEIERLLSILFEISSNERSLSHLYKSAFSVHGSLRSQLYPWAEGVYGHLLNGSTDQLDLTAAPLVTFDMTSLPSGSVIMEVMMDYILHRIRSQVRQQNFPHMIFIDEAAPLLQDQHFCAQVQILLREHRKLRGSINLCFQDAQSIAMSPIRETLLNQCPTLFLFPNANARRQDYEMFNLKESEWRFIKGVEKKYASLSRGVLVKRPESSVILETNLFSLGDFLYLYKSGISFQKTMQTLRAHYGETHWVETYLKFCREGAH